MKDACKEVSNIPQRHKGDPDDDLLLTLSKTFVSADGALRFNFQDATTYG